MPACTPLPDTSTSTTSNHRPSGERVATTKSPENDCPYADSTAVSACHPPGSSGSSPNARSRSRRSTNIDSPRLPWTPSRARDRDVADMMMMTMAKATRR